MAEPNTLYNNIILCQTTGKCVCVCICVCVCVCVSVCGCVCVLIWMSTKGSIIATVSGQTNRKNEGQRERQDIGMMNYLSGQVYIDHMRNQ